jgi:hypothetical protein
MLGGAQMSVKTERITILGSPEFKAFLAKEAKKEQISVSELVRRRCEQSMPNAAEEQLFAELVVELQCAVKRAKKSLNKGLRDANELVAELKANREQSQKEVASG